MNEFGTAIDQAFGLQAQHADAIALVQRLTQQLAEAVSQKTNGNVRVSLLDEPKAIDLARALGRAFGLVRPVLGADDEDRLVRKYVVAEAGGQYRALWHVEFSEAGYPVKIRGPRENQVQLCTSAEDVHDAFVEAAADVRVGRKLQALLDLRSAPALGPQPVGESDREAD